MFWETIILAFALSTDAFCLALGLTAQGVRKLKAWYFTLVVGLLHILLPLLGLFLGQSAQRFLGFLARPCGALVLIAVGGRVIWEALKKDPNERVSLKNNWYLLMMALAVSLDSLVVGFGLGAFGFSYFQATLIFGFTAALLTRIAFYFGNHLSCQAKSLDCLTGIVLVALGIKSLL